MFRFRDLIKAKYNFIWNESLNNLFNKSKQILIQDVENGISFDTRRTGTPIEREALAVARALGRFEL